MSEYYFPKELIGPFIFNKFATDRGYSCSEFAIDKQNNKILIRGDVAGCTVSWIPLTESQGKFLISSEEMQTIIQGLNILPEVKKEVSVEKVDKKDLGQRYQGMADDVYKLFKEEFLRSLKEAEWELFDEIFDFQPENTHTKEFSRLQDLWKLQAETFKLMLLADELNLF